jgi:flagellar basal body-associated protein FliL
MSQRNWIILAVVVVVVLVGGYMYWPGTTGDTPVAPADNAETTAPAE